MELIIYGIKYLWNQIFLNLFHYSGSKRLQQSRLMQIAEAITKVRNTSNKKITSSRSLAFSSVKKRFVQQTQLYAEVLSG